jgi:hypothetical protein
VLEAARAATLQQCWAGAATALASSRFASFSNLPQMAARVGDEVGSNGPLSEVPLPVAVAALEAVDVAIVDDWLGTEPTRGCSR